MKLTKNLVFLEPLPRKTQSNGGILFSPTHQDDEKQFRVIAVGPGRKSKRGIMCSPEVRPGDCVLTNQYLGPKITLPGGRVIVDADELVAKWEDAQAVYEHLREDRPDLNIPEWAVITKESRMVAAKFDREGLITIRSKILLAFDPDRHNRLHPFEINELALYEETPTSKTGKLDREA